LNSSYYHDAAVATKEREIVEEEMGKGRPTEMAYGYSASPDAGAEVSFT
jgi:hypothetical protein